MTITLYTQVDSYSDEYPVLLDLEISNENLELIEAGQRVLIPSKLGDIRISKFGGGYFISLHRSGEARSHESELAHGGASRLDWAAQFMASAYAKNHLTIDERLGR